MTIGVFDSGIGGLAFFQELDRYYPSLSKVYLGDHANLPYGEKSPEEIARLTYIGVIKLADLGCTRIVIACNTASILAVPYIKERLHDSKYQIEIIDISSPTIRFLKSQLNSVTCSFSKSVGEKWRVGVFATSATAQSEYFKTEIKQLKNTNVQQVACHQLVEFIENARSVEDMSKCICTYVGDLCRKFSGEQPHIVLLGCTHYSLVLDFFRKALGDECKILCQERLLMEYMHDLDVFSTCTSKPSIRRLLTTGDKNKANTAAKCLRGDNFFEFEHFN